MESHENNLGYGRRLLGKDASKHAREGAGPQPTVPFKDILEDSHSVMNNSDHHGKLGKSRSARSGDCSAGVGV